MDTKIGCFIKPEVGYAETQIQSRVQEAVKLVRERGVSPAQAARDLDVHENVLRKWVKEFGSDPAQAFPGYGQMKPEQQEIERLRREVNKLKAERDILKRPRPSSRRKRHEVRLHFARHRNIWPVAWLCDAMDVSRSGFHAWLNRSPRRFKPARRQPSSISAGQERQGRCLTPVRGKRDIRSGRAAGRRRCVQRCVRPDCEVT